MAGFIKYGKTGSHTMDFDKIDWFKLHNDMLKIAGSQKTLDEFFEKMKNDKMSKCKTNTKHLYIRIAKTNSNRKMVKCMATMKNKKDQKEEKADEDSKIVSDTDSWITVSDKAVFVNIPVGIAEKIPISEYTNDDGVTLKRLTLVGSKAILEKLLSGEKKGVPLGYFKE